VSCLAAVPMGIWEQTVGAVRKHSREKSDNLAAVLSKIAGQGHLERDLADATARCLESQALDPVIRTGAPLEFAASGTRKANEADTAQPSTVSRCKTALGIQVITAELAGKRHNSSSRALSVEVHVTVCRTSDGQEIYSCPIRYRSASRKLEDWSASGAKLFRQELQDCSRQTAQALAQELLRRGLATPKPGLGPI